MEVDPSRTLASSTSIVLATCTDGVQHAFAELSDGHAQTPVCGRSVVQFKTEEQGEDVCPDCAAAVLRWAGMPEDEIAEALAPRLR